jgi:hypothetical protein
MHRIPMAAVICVVLVCNLFAVKPSTNPLHQIIGGEDYAVAIPADWNLRSDMQPTMPVYAGGSRPTVDENGSPLQIGLTVEHWPDVKKPLDERRQIQVDAVAHAKALVPVGEPIIQEVTLDDGTPALLMIHEFHKERGRHSLQIKLLANAPDGSAWCASGFLVGGLKSKVPTPTSDQAKWLVAYVRSFCFDRAKLDQSKLPGPFVDPPSKP